MIQPDSIPQLIWQLEMGCGIHQPRGVYVKRSGRTDRLAAKGGAHLPQPTCAALSGDHLGTCIEVQIQAGLSFSLREQSVFCLCGRSASDAAVPLLLPVEFLKILFFRYKTFTNENLVISPLGMNQ